jgi:hypothetical protein
MTIRELLEGRPANVRTSVEKLRRLVMDAMPAAEETIADRKLALTYHHPEAGYVCGIFLFDDHVKVIFEHGAALADPAHVLQASTKGQARFVQVAKTSDIRPAPMRMLITEAVEVTSRIRRGRKP